MFVLLKHLCFVDVVVVEVLVVVDEVEVDVVEVVDRDVEEVVVDDVVDVVEVEDVVEDVVVVVSQPPQVLAQRVMLATRLSHKPCSLKAMHWLGDNVSFFPSQESAAVNITNNCNVDVDAMLVVVSHWLHVLSHPPATRVSHKPLEKIP